MKITEVKTYFASTLRQNWLFVKVMTDEGLYGWGEASIEGQEKAVEQSIQILATRSVVGEDPRNIERIWHKMYRHGFWKGGFIYMTAISGIDQALWDLLGKIYNVPTYMLLGGAVRNKIRTYSHASNAEIAMEVIEQGFDGVKTAGSTLGEIYDADRAPAELEARLASIRDAIGPDKILCIDNHGQSNPAVAVKLIEVASRYNAYFFEEPVPPENHSAYQRIRQHDCRVPIAGGERLFSRFEFRQIFEEQLFDIIQPDISHCGGITEIRKVAFMAEPYHIRFAPHNPNGPVATAASLHLCAATQSFDVLEFVAKSIYASSDIFNIPLKPKDGYFDLPEGPGLGIELDESAFDDHPHVFMQYDPRYAPDGTVEEI